MCHFRQYIDSLIKIMFHSYSHAGRQPQRPTGDQRLGDVSRHISDLIVELCCFRPRNKLGCSPNPRELGVQPVVLFPTVPRDAPR